MKIYKPGDSFIVRDGSIRTIIRDNRDFNYFYAAINDQGLVVTRWYDNLEDLLKVYFGPYSRMINKNYYLEVFPNMGRKTLETPNKFQS